MARLNLTNSQQQELQHLARRSRDARLVRRAQGLLWLDQGEHPIAVAQRLGVTREAVYSWVRRLQQEGSRSVAEKLSDQPRSGCPRRKRQAVAELVKQVLDTRPSEYGYQAEGWTAALLASTSHRGYCSKRHHGTPVSEGDGLPVETTQVSPGPPGPLLAASKRGLKRGLKGRQRTVVLFTDATIITETRLWGPGGPAKVSQ